MKDDERKEREFDAITLLLAGVLSAIVLGAIGFGIAKSSKVATTIPAAPISSGAPAPPPAITTGAR
jgi:hypothetical protein